MCRLRDMRHRPPVSAAALPIPEIGKPPLETGRAKSP
jgi:hypothetical protein